VYFSVSMVVGTTVTRGLTRRAYSARYGLPAMTCAAMRQIERVLPGNFR
jgi:hypothetical protein